MNFTVRNKGMDLLSHIVQQLSGFTTGKNEKKGHGSFLSGNKENVP